MKTLDCYIIHRRGTPKEWHQLVGQRESEAEADMCVRCALDMSGLSHGYIAQGAAKIRYYGKSSSLRPVPKVPAPTTPAGNKP